jgi:3-oxoacyl-[acyl-carrier-protein] synthase-1
MRPLLLSHFTAATCLGHGVDAHLMALREGRSGLAPCTFETVDLDTYVGEVLGVDETEIRSDLIEYDCRNNRLAQLGLEQDGLAQAVERVAERYGPQRVGVFIGTSTSGILQTEQAYRHRDPQTGALPPEFCYETTHNAFGVADFVRRYCGLQGPAAVVTVACASSAKVFGSAWRLIEAGLIDAALVGGVDSLCLTTLYGFNSLELVSRTPCRPFDRDRDGISIGEAAAFVLLTRAPDDLDDAAVLLLGLGESSDSYHMSSPHPEGLGARIAMERALASAHLGPEAIDYLNLHGTATHSNDASEGQAVADLFGRTVPCSSTKGATGHTLGAAGAVEAILCALALREGFLPGGVGTQNPDPEIGIGYLMENIAQAPRRILSNSFGFGGSNCSLVLGRAG